MGWIVGWKFPLFATKFFEMMVARDGVEPPTPAFSECVQPVFLRTYKDTWDCQVLVSSCKTR